jgi:hypothetical protein
LNGEACNHIASDFVILDQGLEDLARDQGGHSFQRRGRIEGGRQRGHSDSELSTPLPERWEEQAAQEQEPRHAAEYAPPPYASRAHRPFIRVRRSSGQVIVERNPPLASAVFKVEERDGNCDRGAARDRKRDVVERGTTEFYVTGMGFDGTFVASPIDGGVGSENQPEGSRRITKGERFHAVRRLKGEIFP